MYALRGPEGASPVLTSVMFEPGMFLIACVEHPGTPG
jgi:hypothetical protein